VEPLFDDIEITAKMNHQLRNVGGLEGFMCTENHHIFFVMKKDIETESASGWALQEDNKKAAQVRGRPSCGNTLR
jgi:hypothetical protein